MKGLIGAAVLLGIAGVVLAVIALMGEGDKFEVQTLELQGEPVTEHSEFPAPAADRSNPIGTDGFTAHREITGDATGEQIITCLPSGSDIVECAGGFVLEDGDIEIEGTERADDDGQATSAVVGGTGAYEGAVGSMDVEFEAGPDDQSQSYTLHLHLPNN